MSHVRRVSNRMTAPCARSGTSRRGLTRRTGVAVAIWLSAWLALLPAHNAAAQESRRIAVAGAPLEGLSAGSDRGARHATEAKQSFACGEQERTARRPRPGRATTADAAGVRRRAARARRGRGDADVAGGRRRRRESEPAAATMPLRVKADRGRSLQPRGTARRAASRRSATKTTARSTATHGRGDAGDRTAQARCSPMTSPAPTPRSPPRRSAARDPGGGASAGRSAARPRSDVGGGDRMAPDRRRVALLRHRPGRRTRLRSRNRPRSIGRPSGPAAVQAVTDAADELAATLVAAGWKPLPPGRRLVRQAVRLGARRRRARPGSSPAGPAATPRPSTPAQPVTPPRPAAQVPRGSDQARSSPRQAREAARRARRARRPRAGRRAAARRRRRRRAREGRRRAGASTCRVPLLDPRAACSCSPCMIRQIRRALR